MDSMFNNCTNLKYLPDISKWNTSNVNDLISIFNGYVSLLSLPDISKWDISHVNSLRVVFQ